jgi:hypothetical protein
MNWIAALGVIFVLIGGGLLAAAVSHFRRRRAFIKQSTTAKGTIVAFAENREGEEVSYFPRIAFNTPSGREVIFESGAGSSSNPGRIGNTVTVRYRPDQPDVAEIDSFVSLWGPALLLAFLGVLFLSIGLGILAGWLPPPERST